MPYCPKCRYEYEAGVGICPDCDEKLVEALPPEPDEVDEKIFEDWTALARLRSTQMAEMILEALRAKDIPAVLQSGVGYFGYVGTQGLSSYAPVGGGYTLLVPEEYIEQAAGEVEIILGDDWEKSKLIEIN